jgi:hypothetical protein
MLNDVIGSSPASVATAPYSVDVSKGSLDGTVSNQWMSRPADQKFATLGDLYRSKKLRHETSWEKRLNTDKFEIIAPDVQSIEDTHKLRVGVSGIKTGGDVSRSVEVVPTHWAFGQLAQLASSPAAFLRELPSQMTMDIINYRMRFARAVEEVKLYGSPEELFAATGPSYGRIPDHEVIKALMQIAGDGLGQDGFHWKTPGKLNWSNGTYDPEDIGETADRTFYGSDRDTFVFLVDDRRPIVVGKTKTGAPDHMFRGFYIQNSETGSRSLKISAFYLRGVCMNRNLWGCEGFQEITIRHTSVAPDRWIREALPALESFASGSDRKLIESVEMAKAKQLVETQDAAIDFLKRRNFSVTQARKIWETHEREEERPMLSAWDFAQGITAFARTAINTDDRVSIELKAKDILDKVA